MLNKQEIIDKYLLLKFSNKFKVDFLTNENNVSDFSFLNFFDKNFNYLIVDQSDKVIIEISCDKNSKKALLKSKNIFFPLNRVINSNLYNHIKYQDIDSTYIIPGAKIDKNVELEKGVFISEDSKVGSGTIIKANSEVINSYIGLNNFIGQFTIIRNKSSIGNDNVIGPHNEIKESKIKNKNNISHKCFIGNCLIGNSNTFGCGFITANFNKEKINTSKIGNNNFFGIMSSIVSPVNVGNGCFIAANSMLLTNLTNNQKFKSTVKN